MESLEAVEYVNPSEIVAADNIRHSINTGPLELLMKDIVAQGGVQEPVTVEDIGGKYHLRKGFRRHAAVSKLNEQGAGLMLPVIVRSYTTDQERLKAQIAENVVRESLSPIDTAIAMQKLLDAGLSRIEIRETFARATPKGSKPLSNAQMNIYLNMLQLPKSIQAKIHDGRVGVKAAYELSKVSPDHREEVLARAEAEAEKEAAKEEAEENRYLKAVEREQKQAQKAEAQAQKLATAEKEVEEARKADKDAAALVKTRAKELEAAEKAKGKATEFRKLPVEKQKEINESIKGAEKTLQGAEKERRNASARLAKALATVSSLKEKVEEAEEEPVAETAAPAKVKAAKPVTDTQVKSAAKEVTGDGSVPLTLSDIRVAFRDIAKSDLPRVKKLGETLQALLTGKLTTKETIHDIGVLVGDVKDAPAKVKKAS
jgi:ParB/RepB/Spo0J family partition protein